jgi:hypothetical protein
VKFGLRTQAPDCKAGVGDPNHPAHPLRPSIEFGMAEKAPNKRSHFVLPHAHHHQAVASMPEVRAIEACVTGEECWIGPPAQQNDDLFVFQAFATKVDSNLPRSEPPCFEQYALSVEDVLVEDDQA